MCQKFVETKSLDIALVSTWLSYALGFSLVQILIPVSQMVPKILKLPKQISTPYIAQGDTHVQRLNEVIRQMNYQLSPWTLKKYDVSIHLSVHCSIAVFN